MTTILPPGTTAFLNDKCMWEERRGCVVLVVDTRGAEQTYPVHGLGKDEVIVYVNADPIGDRYDAHRLVNGHPWSCVTSFASLDVIQEDKR